MVDSLNSLGNPCAPYETSSVTAPTLRIAAAAIAIFTVAVAAAAAAAIAIDFAEGAIPISCSLGRGDPPPLLATYS